MSPSPPSRRHEPSNRRRSGSADSSTLGDPGGIPPFVPQLGRNLFEQYESKFGTARRGDDEPGSSDPRPGSAGLGKNTRFAQDPPQQPLPPVPSPPPAINAGQRKRKPSPVNSMRDDPPPPRVPSPPPAVPPEQMEGMPAPGLGKSSRGGPSPPRMDPSSSNRGRANKRLKRRSSPRSNKGPASSKRHTQFPRPSGTTPQVPDAPPAGPAPSRFPRLPGFLRRGSNFPSSSRTGNTNHSSTNNRVPRPSRSSNSPVTYELCGHLADGHKWETVPREQIHTQRNLLSEPTLCRNCKNQWSHDPSLIPVVCETYVHLQRRLMKNGIWQPTHETLHAILENARDRYRIRFPAPPIERTGIWTWASPPWDKWDSLRALLVQERSKPVEQSWSHRDPLVWLFEGSVTERAVKQWKDARSKALEESLAKIPQKIEGPQEHYFRHLIHSNEKLKENERLELEEMRATCEAFLQQS